MQPVNTRLVRQIENAARMELDFTKDLLGD
jgi:hypothetical protein